MERATIALRSARDRDRLREEVLRGLGWRIHRIWSTAWFHDPEREIQKVVESIEVARKVQKQTPPKPPVEKESEPENQDIPTTEAPSPNSTNRYTTTDLSIDLRDDELHEVPSSQLASWMALVVEAEGPVHEEIVARRIALAAGVTRKGSRIQSAMSAAIREALRSGEIKRRGKFLHTLGAIPQVRDRSRLDSAERGVEYICPEEVELAIQQTLEATHGGEAQEVVTLVARQFGISRAGKDVRTVLSKQIKRLRRSGRIIERQGFLEWVDPATEG